jgi:hypothetical protein
LHVSKILRTFATSNKTKQRIKTQVPEGHKDYEDNEMG